MKWTTPMRMDGHRVLSIIPNEIYLETFDWITESMDFTREECRETLANLALVCHLFCAIAVPRIFKSLHFSGNTSNTSGSENTSAAFCRTILKGEQPATSLACHVEECCLDSWKQDGLDPWINTAFLDMYRRAMKRMPNLCRLHLTEVKIDKSMLKTICGLRKVKELTLGHCTFFDDITTDTVEKMKPLELEEFAFYHSSHTELFDIHLEAISRITDASKLQSFLSTHPGVTEEIFSHIQEESALVKLELLSAELTPALWNVLTQSKCLTNVELSTLFTDTDVQFAPLPSTSLPRLQKLKCPPSLLDMIPGRPVSSIDLTGVIFLFDEELPMMNPKQLPLMGLQEIALLKKSSTDILRLSIPSHLYFVVPIFDNFPCVRELDIEYEHDNFKNQNMKLSTLINNLVKQWPPAPSVLTLELGLPRRLFCTDLPLQHRQLSKLMIAFPSICTVTFGLGPVMWYRKHSDDTWSGRVLPCFRNIIREVIQTDQDLLKLDFDGIYAAILPQDSD